MFEYCKLSSGGKKCIIAICVLVLVGALLLLGFLFYLFHLGGQV